jgi:hypothetical protein
VSTEQVRAHFGFPKMPNGQGSLALGATSSPRPLRGGHADRLARRRTSDRGRDHRGRLGQDRRGESGDGRTQSVPLHPHLPPEPGSDRLPIIDMCSFKALASETQGRPREEYADLQHPGFPVMITLWLAHVDIRSTDPPTSMPTSPSRSAVAATTPATVAPGRYRPPDAVLPSSPSSRACNYADICAVGQQQKPTDAGLFRSDGDIFGIVAVSA